MKKILSIFIQRPVSTLMLFITLTLIGTICVSRIPITYYPVFKIPKLSIITKYDGLPAKDVRQLLTIPLEDALSSVSNIKQLKSISRDGLSLVELEFHWGTNILESSIEVREIIDRTYIILPQNAEKPQILPIDPSSEATITLGLFNKNLELGAMRRLAEKEIKTQLQQLSTVGSIQIMGGVQEEVQVQIDQNELSSRKMTISQLSEIIKSLNVDYPAGKITQGNLDYIIKTKGKAETISQINNMYINTGNNGFVKLLEIAKIKKEERDQTDFFQFNSREGIALLIRPKGGISPLDLSQEILEEIEQLNKAYSRDLEIQLIYDKSKLIKKNLLNILFSASIGAFIAFLVLLIFTRNIKESLIIILSIPLSVIIAMIGLKLTNVSINTISLSGFAIAIGMLVDNSVVVLEALSKIDYTQKTKNRKIVETTQVLSKSMAGSTFTSIIVFMPLIFLPGLIGSIFRDLAFTVIYSLIASLLVAVILVPVIYSIISNRVKERQRKSRFERFVSNIYSKTSKKYLWVILGTLLLIPVGLITIPMIQKEFLPQINENSIKIEIHYPSGSSIEYLKNQSFLIDQKLGNIDFINDIVSVAGRNNNDPYYLSNINNKPEIIHKTIYLKDGIKKSNEEVIETLKQLLVLRDVQIIIKKPENILSKLIGIQENLTEWIVSGNSQQEALDNTMKYSSILSENGYNPYILPIEKKKQINLIPDRESISQKEMDLRGLSLIIANSLYGKISSQIELNGYDYNVRTILNKEQRNEIGALRNLQIPMQSGNHVQLSELFIVNESEKTSSLLRKERKDSYVLRVNSDIEKETLLNLSGNNIERSDKSLLEENLKSIFLVFLLGIILLYLLLGAQFESFRLPIIFMISIPFSFIGILLGLFLSNKTINFHSSMGALVLLGIIVNNAIILFDVYQNNLKKGMPLSLAVAKGTIERVRPIIITSLTTVLSLLPLAIDIRNTSPQSSMAIAIIGGLTISTIVTLFIFPFIFYKLKERKKYDNKR